MSRPNVPPIENLVGAIDAENKASRTFPGLVKREVGIFPGVYKPVTGHDKPVHFNADNLHFNIVDADELIPGVRYHGEYFDTDDTDVQAKPTKATLPVVSFLYNKRDVNGEFETQERVVILRGVGYGEHPAHPEQAAGEYLIGAQIGTIDHDTGTFSSLQHDAAVIEPKHFSVDCITGSPVDRLLVANPAQ